MNSARMASSGAPRSERHPSLSQLRALGNRARELRKVTHDAGPTPTPHTGPMPLSYAQERLWFLDQLGLAGCAYNMSVVLKLEGALNLGALELSFAELIKRHEILRTRFAVQDGSPVQIVISSAEFRLEVVDLSETGDAVYEAKISRLIRERLNLRFDLSAGQLLRVAVFKRADDQHCLQIVMHHSISDGWSLAVLQREINEIYSTFLRGGALPFREQALQYSDYAIWERQRLPRGELQADLNYWTKRLEGASPQLDLPTDFPRPQFESFAGATVRFELNGSLYPALKQLARREGCTIFMVCLTAYNILLARWTGQDDILVGTPIAGRHHRNVENLLGFFVNTLVLRNVVTRDLSFRQLLAQVRETTLGAYAHQKLPFESLVAALRPDRNLTRQPLFQVMLAMQNYPRTELDLPGIACTQVELESQITHFDLTLYLEETADRLTGHFEYATDLFEAESIHRMAGHFRSLLEAAVADPERSIGLLPMLGSSELRLLHDLHGVSVSVETEATVHRLYEKQVRSTPQVTALVHAEQRLSYAELNGAANQLARHLISRGVGPGEVVGICMERGPAMVLGLLGILKAGAAYVPLDPNYPADRLQYMIEDAHPRAVVTEQALTSLFAGSTADILVLDESLSAIAGQAREDLSEAESAAGEQDLVYVIYTSGSTGRPKGTAMAHRSMVNLIEWHRKELPTQEGQRVLQFAALSFDVAFQEIFSTLCSGATLVLLNEWVRRDTRALAQLLDTERIERLFVPPLMLQSLAEHSMAAGTAPQALRDVITAGEQLRVSPQIVSFFKRLGAGQLHNHYGPTESHVVTALTLSGDPAQWPALPTIGRPIANAQIYILDEQRQLLPRGVSGEIYIGGTAVARGYRGRAELTAQRFIKDPFSTDPGARLYKTGDLGRWRVDGTLEYLGRNDYQVKIRGYRIELGEIETQLARHPLVKDAVVTVREDGAQQKRLVAHVTLRTATRPSAEELRTHLKSGLPEHMVPAAFVILDHLPLTPSGKLDRNALPAPQSTDYATQDFQPPQGELEHALAQIWQELLGVERIGRHDNFFDLGGHSLLALKALDRINSRCSSDLKATDIYRSPTLGSLAAHLLEGTEEQTCVDLLREATLDADIIPSTHSGSSTVDNILLTGSTGFVGRFLLKQLLMETRASVFCLVRGNSADHAAARVHQTLAEVGMEAATFEGRIVAIPADLRDPLLGLDESMMARLGSDVDSILHCATSMNHLETYATAAPANVHAVKRLLKMATTGKPKTFNYISTLGIFAPDASGHSRVVNELTPIENEKHSVHSGYVASKWVGEKLSMIAAARGIPCNIFRLGLAWAESHEGWFDDRQHTSRLIRSCLLSGCGIQDFYYESTPVPVDYVSRAILSLANLTSDGGGIFHLTSNQRPVDGLFEQCNAILEKPLELLPFRDWLTRMKRLRARGLDLPIAPLLDLYDDSNATGTKILFDCAATDRRLMSIGMQTPRFEAQLLEPALHRMLNENPRGRMHER